MLKKFWFIMCCALLLLCGCGTQKNDNAEVVEYTPKEIMAKLVNEVPIEGELYYFGDADQYAFSDEIYKYTQGFFAIKGQGAVADEYIIVKSDSIGEVAQILDEYRESRLADFMGYGPSEAEKIENTEVVSRDKYVALLISDKSTEANAYFDKIIKDCPEMTGDDEVVLSRFDEGLASTNESFGFADGDENDGKLTVENSAGVEPNATEKDEQGEVETEEIAKITPKTKTTKSGQVLIEEVQGYFDVFDDSKIVEAYKTGNDSLLADDKEIAVLKKCREIIAEIITDDMSEFEKELAIHDYIILNTEYDENAMEYSGWFTEYTDQPYGCLITNRAICLGYTTTFQLFMDMLDIECRVVTGHRYYTEENHAWNMVRLDDGNWYFVDVTWDDPVLSPKDITYHDYFNVSEKGMDLQLWDKDKYPEVKGGKYSNMVKDEAPEPAGRSES